LMDCGEVCFHPIQIIPSLHSSWLLESQVPCLIAPLAFIILQMRWGNHQLIIILSTCSVCMLHCCSVPLLCSVILLIQMWVLALHVFTKLWLHHFKNSG
jgi:hypothetical protein